MIQELITYLIISGAVFFVIQAFYKSIRTAKKTTKRSCSKGMSCSGCPIVAFKSEKNCK